MATALLAGAFGQRNPGDDALLEAFVRALPGWDTVATTSQRLADPDGDGAHTTVAADEPASVARSAANADAVVFAGGTIFKTLPSRTGRGPLDLLRNGLALAYGAKALGKPLALVGVGAAPIASRSGQVLARRLVAQADLLVLRDEESADVLTQLGATTPFRVGADPAWTLLDGPPSSDVTRPGPVVVALSGEAASDGDGAMATGLADDLAAALVPVLAAGHPVALQPWRIGGATGPDDLDLARAVNARLGSSAQLIMPPADLEAARALFAGARLVVGLRLHALIAAAGAGAPFVAVAHEPKLAAAARRMGQRAVVPDPAGGLDPAQLATAILAAIDAPSPPRPSAVQGEVTRAEQGFRLLRLLLSGGRSDDAETIGALPLRPAEWSS